MDPAGGRHDDAIDFETGQSDDGADDQCHIEAADDGGLPANKGSKRDSKEKRAVVPSKHRTAPGRKVVGKA